MLLEQLVSAFHKRLLAKLPTQPPEFREQHLRNLSDEELRQWQIGYCPGNSVYPEGLQRRITVPIRDAVGNVLSIAGRTLADDPRKWWHLPFPKQGVLFGLDQAWRTIAQLNGAVLVEGYWDVIALHRAGLRCTVGVMGSAASRRQLLLLATYCNRFLFLPDQDEQGITGARKTCSLAANYGCRARVIETTVPYGDPDELVRKHSDRLADVLR